MTYQRKRQCGMCRTVDVRYPFILPGSKPSGLGSGYIATSNGYGLGEGTYFVGGAWGISDPFCLTNVSACVQVEHRDRLPRSLAFDHLADCAEESEGVGLLCFSLEHRL